MNLLFWGLFPETWRDSNSCGRHDTDTLRFKYDTGEFTMKAEYDYLT